MAADNLPRHLTSFIGRESEQHALLELLDRAPLLTLTGAGGSGKTRLAVQVATRAAKDFVDGVWWLGLAPVAAPEMVVPALGQVLGVRPRVGQTELEVVLSHLAGRRALLVLDNCEHVLDETARLAEELVRGCSHLRVLATSREPLRADGETEWRVPPLSLPPREEERASADSSDAVRLFVERACQVKPGFALTSENQAAVLHVCRGLDGIPLAIELAAARLRAFSPQQIADGLTNRLRFLTTGTRTAVRRQQTLRASIDWSHDLLSEPERALFRRLSVFIGGFTTEAAERICAGDGFDPGEVIELLGTLVDKSVVQAEEHGPAVRYRLLEIMREYALERLHEVEEITAVRARHRDYFVELAESNAAAMLSPRQTDAMRVLDPEGANFQQAIEWAASTDRDKALRLCVALTMWWRLRSRFAEADASFTLALGPTTEPSLLEARALWGRALLLTFSGSLVEAYVAARAALDAAEVGGDESTTARSLWLVGIMTMWPDPVGSRPGLQRARELAAASGDAFALLHATQALGMSYSMQDAHDEARPLHQEALTLAERTGQQDAVAWYWAASAMGSWVAGDLAALREAAEKALAVASSIGDFVTETTAIFGLTLADIEAGQPQEALEQLDALEERALTRGGSLTMPAASLGRGMAYAADGLLDRARSELTALIDRNAMGWSYVLGRAHAIQAEVLRLLGDEGARAAAEAGLEVARLTGSQPVAAEAQLVIGRLSSARGEWREAQQLLHEVLPSAAERGSPRVPRVLEALAEVAAGLESIVEASRILGAASRQWSDAGIVPWPHQRCETEALAEHLRAALGTAAFETALTEGRAMTADDAIAYVRRARGERRRPSVGWQSLTPTELKVAHHAAAGMTNPQIAEVMFISRGTVRTHLSHIFAKLGVKNRAELAGEVARREDPSGS